MTRVVLVTGGTRGVGRGIARAFRALGDTVVVCGRKPPEHDDGTEFVAADVREAEQVAALVDGIVARHGRLDVVVNNAGGAPPADAAKVSPRFHEAILRLNLTAPLHVAQRANAVMQQQDTGGVIVNVASVSGLRPSPGTAAYGAAKAGLIHLTRSLAVEWAPKVRVVCLSPGMVRTEQTDLHYADLSAVEATVPAGRLATPDEIGGVCVFLASDAASYASGTNLVLEGGGEKPAFLTAQEKA